MKGETVLITGASSGIGRELARLFAADGSQVILLARNQQRLDELADELRTRYQTEPRILIKDLSKPDAAREVFESLEQSGTQVDVLVNNAGHGMLGRFRKIPLEQHQSILQVNVIALTELSRLFLPGMIERRRGGILNVGSTASFQPGPNAAVYYATKAYVLSLTQALVNELEGTDVTVSCLAPGPTKTGFGDLSGMESTPVFKLASMDVEPVARAGYHAFRKGNPLVVPGFLNRAMIFSQRFVPRWLVRRIVIKRMQPFTDDP